MPAQIRHMITSARDDVKQLHNRGQEKSQAWHSCLPILDAQWGTLLLGAFDFRCLSGNLIVDAPVEAAFSIDELYVN